MYNYARRRYPRLCVLIVMALGLAAMSGCGKTCTVSGQVTLKGAPLPSGKITFLSEVGNKEAFYSLIKDGAYSISGVPAGPVQVRIETFMPVTVDPVGGKGGNPVPEQGKYVPIPPRYGDFKKSGLGFEVNGDDSGKNFDLKP